jgi:hypothetical protein
MGRSHYYYSLTYDDLVNAHAEIESYPYSKIEKGIQKPGLLRAIANRPDQKHYNGEHFPDIY